MGLSRNSGRGTGKEFKDGCKPIETHGKHLEIESSLFPLADGVPDRVGLLRGAGNAIVPQVAAVFVKAFMDVEGSCG